MAKITKYKPGSEVLWELRSTFWQKSNPTKFSIIAYVYAERWLSTKLSEIGFKIMDHVLVNNAMSKKINMADDQLTDFDKTELRTKSQIGCPNILFKQKSTVR